MPALDGLFSLFLQKWEQVIDTAHDLLAVATDAPDYVIQSAALVIGNPKARLA